MRDNSLKSTASRDWMTDVDQAGFAAVPDIDDEDRPIPSARGVLTKAEIEALLRPNLPDNIGVATPTKHIEARPPVNFDDAPRQQTIDPIEREAGALAARLSLALGRSTGVKAAIALREVQTMDTRAVPDLIAGKAVAVACFGETEAEITTLVCIPATLADALIAKACGAQSSTGRIGDGWALSAIDCALLEQLLGPLKSALGDHQSLQTIETDVSYVANLLPTGEVTIAEYGVEAPGLRSDLAVIRTAAKAHTPEPLENLRRRAPVTALMTARIASLSVPLSRLSDLKAGSTLLLGLPADQPVEILSGDRDGPVAFEGQVGRKGNKVAVKITRKRRGVLD